MKILVVDDKEEERYLAETLLKGSGYEVVTAVNGAEALEKLRAESVDMIISDILMPVMDGFQLCKECKEDEKLRDIPFVFYTGEYVDEQDENLAIQIQADRFIQKPIEPDEFIKLIQGVFRDVEEDRISQKKPVTVGMKILIVEDNEDSRILLMKQLRASGYEVMAAADGVEALQQALAETPDILISDIMMPNMDGYQLCQQCKQNDKLKDIPFVFYTATYMEEEDEKLALSLGANTFIRKPTEPGALAQILSEIVEKAQSGALAPPKITPLEPSLFLTEYNKRIVAKLEEKMAQLETEITERKLAEEALRGSEERYRSTLDNMLEGCQIIGYDWRYLYMNDVIARQGRKAKEELLGHTMIEMYPDIENTEMFAALRRCMEKRIPHRMENEFTFSDGAKGYFELSIQPVPDGVFILSLDITERKQAEEQLRQSEEKYSTLVEQGNDGIIIIQDGLLKFANSRMVEMSGFSLEKVLGKSFIDFVSPEYKELVVDRFKKRVSGEEVPSNYEIAILAKDGRKIPVEINASRIEYDGRFADMAIIRDITERKRMEEQLIVTDRLASIGELSSGIAHELNNPLTGVIGFSDLLLDRDLPDDIKEDLEVINREAKRTAMIVRNLLTFARKHPEEKQPVDINKTIPAVLELRAYEQKLNNIQVDTRFAPDLPEIVADGFQLQQVFLNIIINAEHFMTEAHGRGTLTITTERVGDIIRVSFADDGPGIAEENLGHLFDPFFTTKEVGKGTGLGLSICHGIITEHGGRVYAESKLGKGATFVVELPINK